MWSSLQTTSAALESYFSSATRLLCVGDTVSIHVPPCTSNQGILQTLHGLHGTAADRGSEGLGHRESAEQGTLTHFRVAELKPDADTALAFGSATVLYISVRLGSSSYPHCRAYETIVSCYWFAVL